MPASKHNPTAEHIRVALKCLRVDCVKQHRGAFALMCFDVVDHTKIIKELEAALASAEGRKDG